MRVKIGLPDYYTERLTMTPGRNGWLLHNEIGMRPHGLSLQS